MSSPRRCPNSDALSPVSPTDFSKVVETLGRTDPRRRQLHRWDRRRGDPALGSWLDDLLNLIGESGHPVGTVAIFRWFSGSVGLGDATVKDGLPVAVASAAPGIDCGSHRNLACSCNGDAYEKMGTGWSQNDDLSDQSEPNKEEESKNSENRPLGNPVCNFASETNSKNGNNKAMEAEKTVPEAIHNLDSIIKDADSAIDRFSEEKLSTRLQHGILLNQNKQASLKFWVDKMSKNCFMLYARDLLITWSDDNRYWMWRQLKDSSDQSIEVAELMNVCWLEVHGKLDTGKLSPGTLYEVALVVMLKNAAYGWEIPVNVSLNLPDGRKQEQKVNMLQQPREQWTEIPVGEFRTAPEIRGEIQSSIYEFDGGKWKRGLVNEKGMGGFRKLSEEVGFFVAAVENCVRYWRSSMMEKK
ncbi:hypothetical protein TIFTF001_029340 [Ficus carica]|uniref:Uncharacterized protein n=1 Tax=Ficus carica TaxID=3494 RepID=A0AA88IXW4_FICCA|nr:hypothetical protein TIFTF001_029340 [Ficus carica]